MMIVGGKVLCAWYHFAYMVRNYILFFIVLAVFAVLLCRLHVVSGSTEIPR